MDVSTNQLAEASLRQDGAENASQVDLSVEQNLSDEGHSPKSCFRVLRQKWPDSFFLIFLSFLVLFFLSFCQKLIIFSFLRFNLKN